MRLPLLVLIAAAAPLGRPQSANPPARQALSYSIEWRLITAGKARLELNPLAGQRRGYETKLRVDSVGLVSKLFKVEDDYSAILNPSFCAESIHSTTNEGIRHRETRVTFDSETRKASYLERDRVKNSVLLQKEIEIPPCVHEVVGGLFFLRTLNLEPGQAVQIPISDGKKAVMARVEAQQREDVKTPAGTFKTIRYELFLFNNVLFQRSARLYVWLTDDARKIPAQIRVRLQFTIGTITLLLEKQE